MGRKLIEALCGAQFERIQTALSYSKFVMLGCGRWRTNDPGRLRAKITSRCVSTDARSDRRPRWPIRIASN